MIRFLSKLHIWALVVMCWTIYGSAQVSAASGPGSDSVTIRKSGPSSRHKATFDGQHLSTSNMPLSRLMKLAYGLPGDVTIDGPDWVRWSGYDIEATVKSGTPGVLGPTVTQAASQPALIALLQDRFQMQAHVEQRKQSAFALVIATNGAKLKVASYAKGTGQVEPGGRSGILVGNSATMAMLAKQLSSYGGGKFVFDETNLRGRYDSRRIGCTA